MTNRAERNAIAAGKQRWANCLWTLRLILPIYYSTYNSEAIGARPLDGHVAGRNTMSKTDDAISDSLVAAWLP